MYKILKHTCLAFELFAMNATPARRVTPPWDVYMTNCHPGWQGYPTWQTGQPAQAGHPSNLSCKRDQDKLRNYMDRRVTPLRRATSPTWGPPPPCKQALRQSKNGITCLWFHLGICVHGNNLQSFISTYHLFWNALWFSSEFPCTCRLSNAGRSP